MFPLGASPQVTSVTWSWSSSTPWVRLCASAPSTSWRAWTRSTAIDCVSTWARPTRPEESRTDRCDWSTNLCLFYCIKSQGFERVGPCIEDTGKFPFCLLWLSLREWWCRSSRSSANGRDSTNVASTCPPSTSLIPIRWGTLNTECRPSRLAA